MRHVIPMVAVVLVLCLMLSQCDSQPVPVVQQHHANGNVKVASEVDSSGRRHGMTRNFYEDGTLESEAEFSHDSMNWMRSYWPSGAIREEQSNGVFSTTRKIWAEDGTPLTR